MPVYRTVMGRRALAQRFYRTRALRNLRTLSAISRVGAKRALVARGYTGGALALGALAGYGAYRGIRRIRAARARRIKRRRIGSPMKALGVKNEAVASQDMSISNTRLQYVIGLSNISKGTGINQRMADRVNIKGVKIQFNTQNTITTAAVVLNMAILTPKQGTTVLSTEFFRTYGNDRAMDFGTGLNFIGMNQTPINADQYEVLHRWQYKLSPKANNTGTSEAVTGRTTEMAIRKYVKINRQFQYDSSSGSSPESFPLFLVYWSDLDYSTTGGVQVAALQNQYRVVTYFSDVRV